jgi:molybdate transport system substrate-binding protein
MSSVCPGASQPVRSRLRFPSALVMACVATLGVLLAACGSTQAAQPTPQPVTLTVFAAASLKAAFTEEATKFHAANPNDTVQFTLNGSNTLEAQLEQGAAADVFASADTTNMDKAQTAGLLTSAGAKTFARNRLVVIVPTANPAHIATLKDLAKPGVKIDVAAPAVPAGKYALQALDKLGASADYGPQYEAAVKANFVSQEQAVSAVVQKVGLDEVDAGFVYVTDAATASGQVTAIAIPDPFNVIAVYPIAVLKGSTHATEAQRFVDFVLSSEGEAVLASFSFLPPQ